MDQIHRGPGGAGVGVGVAEGGGDGVSAATLFVTTNLHSPTAWNVDVSSRAGRDGSRSRARSSLCLDGKYVFMEQNQQINRIYAAQKTT